MVFTDIAGSTALRVRLGEEGADGLHRAHDELLGAIVRRHRGEVVKSLGDGIMAAFDAASDAIAATVAMQREIAVLARTVPDAASLAIRVGLSGGDVLWGNGDCHGLPVIEAARLQAAARPGQVVCSALVRTLARGRGGFRFADLGPIEAKGLDEPIPACEILWDDDGSSPLPVRKPASADRSGGAPSRVRSGRHAVPAALTELIGRDSECDRVVALLRRARLVTLTGSGGVGKTRLAAEVARRAAEPFADGVGWADLAPLTDAESVVPTLLDAFVERVELSREPLDVLVTALADRQSLLVIDNCEHLAVEVGRVTRSILERCPSVRILATSQVPLRIPGEKLVAVDPLATESSSLDEPSPAVALFAERAAFAGTFELDGANIDAVVALCRRLDGVPLAIELAASRTRSMSVREIVARLDDRFRLLGAERTGDDGHHRSLDRALAWSYDLLDPVLQSTFDGLSVFVGSFSLADGQGVCADASPLAISGTVDAAPPMEPDIATHITTLVEHSMLTVDRSERQRDRDGPTRYRLLESMKIFGRAQMDAKGAFDRRRMRHARYFLVVAEDIFAGVRGPDEAVWRRSADMAFADLRQAHHYLVDVGDVDAALRMVVALHDYAFFGLKADVGSWASRALAMDGCDTHPLWADATASAAQLAWTIGEVDETASHVHALDGRVPQGSSNFAVEFARGLVLGYGGHVGLMCEHFERCIAIADRDATPYRQAIVHAQVAYALTLSRRTPDQADPMTVSEGPVGLGLDPLIIARRGLLLAESLGNPTAVASANWGLGVALLASDPAAALRHLRIAASVAREVGGPLVEGSAEVTALLVRDPSATPAEELRTLVDRWEYWLGFGSVLQWSVYLRIVFAVHRLGWHREVAVMLGAEESAQPQHPRSAADGTRVTRAVEGLRTEFGDEFAALFRRGEAMSGKELRRFVNDVTQVAIAREEAT